MALLHFFFRILHDTHVQRDLSVLKLEFNGELMMVQAGQAKLLSCGRCKLQTPDDFLSGDDAGFKADDSNKHRMRPADKSLHPLLRTLN
jgi:hypothetical protein